MRHPKVKMKLAGQVSGKAVFIILASTGLLLYLNWEVVGDPVPHVNFDAVIKNDYIQLVPKIQNVSRSEQLMITKTYQMEDKQYDFRIIAIVYNRAKSLARLLNSLNQADYGKDSVKLEVWIDRSSDGTVDPATVETAENFIFLHGQYQVIQHPHHVGIYGQWLTTWKPRLNSSEIAVILEDDLTVSPHFYRYLKLVHKKYDNHPEINGYALQGSSIRHHISNQETLNVPAEHLVYLYPVLGTWGFSPSRDRWMKFLDWFSSVYNDPSFQPYVPNNIVTNWYRKFQLRGQDQGLWSIWHIYFSWRYKQYTLYPNFGGQVGLSVNWREPGLHFVSSESRPSNPALNDWREEFENLPYDPVHIDISGNVIKHPQYDTRKLAENVNTQG